MKAARIQFDLYMVCATLFAWILFTWFEFLLVSIRRESGALLMVSLFYMVLVLAGFLASALRKLRYTAAMSIASFLLLSLFMLGTDYWVVWTGGNVGSSLLCVIMSTFMLMQKKYTFDNSSS